MRRTRVALAAALAVLTFAWPSAPALANHRDVGRCPRGYVSVHNRCVRDQDRDRHRDRDRDRRRRHHHHHHHHHHGGGGGGGDRFLDDRRF